MKTKTRERGLAAMTILFVVTALGLTFAALTGLTGNSMTRSKRELQAQQAFQTAQAAVDYEAETLITGMQGTGGLFTSYQRNVSAVPMYLPSGATGTTTVSPVGDATQAWVTCNVTVGSTARSVRVLLKSKDVGVWNNAVFAGSGASGQSINGNVNIRGSVHLLGDGEVYTDLNGNGHWDAAETYTDLNGNGHWDVGEPFIDANGDHIWNAAEPYNDSNTNGVYDPPMTVTDLNSGFSGSAYLGNNYVGMPAGLMSQVPSITNSSGINTLNAEVRVKHGLIGLSGSATIGLSSNNGNNQGMVDGTYVNDGWTGNQGSSHVYSTNGTTTHYDLGDLVQFPLINGLGAQQYTNGGTTYTNMQTYLDSHSLTVPLTQISETMGAVTYSDGNGNSFQWIPASGGNPAYMIIQGVVRVNGDLTLGLKNQNIYYQGNGTLYSTGTISVHANVLPKAGLTFPTSAVLGLLAARNMNLATGPGDSQLSMAGAFYAQGTVTSQKQNQIAGTFVGNYYDMGSNVPNIYQVPQLAKHMPPGMPGGPIISMTRKTWRERAIHAG